MPCIPVYQLGIQTNCGIVNRRQLSKCVFNRIISSEQIVDCLSIEPIFTWKQLLKTIYFPFVFCCRLCVDLAEVFLVVTLSFIVLRVGGWGTFCDSRATVDIMIRYISSKRQRKVKIQIQLKPIQFERAFSIAVVWQCWLFEQC